MKIEKLDCRAISKYLLLKWLRDKQIYEKKPYCTWWSTFFVSDRDKLNTSFTIGKFDFHWRWRKTSFWIHSTKYRYTSSHILLDRRWSKTNICGTKKGLSVALNISYDRVHNIVHIPNFCPMDPQRSKYWLIKIFLP